MRDRAWARLRDHVANRVRTLPAARLARLGRAREAALHGFDVEPIGPDPAHSGSDPRWRTRAMWSVALACAAALGATYVWEHHDQRVADREHRVRTDDLGPAGEPASRVGPAAALLGHRDFDLVRDAAGQAQAESLAFHAWLAARMTDPAAAAPFALEPASPDAVRPVAPDMPANETDAAL